MSRGEADELGGVVYPELLHQARPVVVNGLRAHAERLGDLRVGLAFDDEQADLPLAVGQPLERVVRQGRAVLPRVGERLVNGRLIPELSARTIATFSRELSARRRTTPMSLRS
jgi:hypothetical protein